MIKYRWDLEILPSDRSTNSSSRTAGGEAECVDTDTAQWAGVVVRHEEALLIVSLFSEKNGSKVISESADGKGSIIGTRCKLMICWLRW